MLYWCSVEKSLFLFWCVNIWSAFPKSFYDDLVLVFFLVWQWWLWQSWVQWGSWTEEEEDWGSKGQQTSAWSILVSRKLNWSSKSYDTVKHLPFAGFVSASAVVLQLKALIMTLVGNIFCDWLCVAGPGECPCGGVERTVGEEKERGVREGEESLGGACKYLLYSFFSPFVWSLFPWSHHPTSTPLLPFKTSLPLISLFSAIPPSLSLVFCPNLCVLQARR